MSERRGRDDELEQPAFLGHPPPRQDIEDIGAGGSLRSLVLLTLCFMFAAIFGFTQGQATLAIASSVLLAMCLAGVVVMVRSAISRERARHPGTWHDSLD